MHLKTFFFFFLHVAVVTLPRYVRVNTLKMATQAVVDQFLKEGYVCLLTKERAITNTKAAGDSEALRY